MLNHRGRHSLRSVAKASVDSSSATLRSSRVICRSSSSAKAASSDDLMLREACRLALAMMPSRTLGREVSSADMVSATRISTACIRAAMMSGSALVSVAAIGGRV